MISGTGKYVLLGSCFSQNMSAKMDSEGIANLCNPLGTLYNPESILITIRQALDGDYTQLPLFWDMDLQEWRCWWANTQLRSGDKEACRSLVDSKFKDLGIALRETDICFLTLGTNVCYRLKDSSITVTNCQRQPDRLFLQVRLSVNETADILNQAVAKLLTANPSCKVVFTVSPYRYKKYGMHGSQLSKAVLLLAIDNVCQKYSDKVIYFPSYEIMMDELRDYAYYAADGLHPSDQAIEIIWKRLCEFPL